MNTKIEREMIKKWDKEFPQYSPNAQGIRKAVVRCIYCLKPETTLCEDCKKKYGEQ